MSRLLAFWRKYFDFGGRPKNPGKRSSSEAPNVAPAENPNIFKVPWVLTLRTEVPKIAISSISMSGLQRKLQDYYWRVKVVVTYFPDGKYLIDRDGSMHLLAEDENARYSEYPQVTAALDFSRLPYAGTIARRIAHSSQKSLLYGKGYVPLQIHARGTIVNGQKQSDCMPDFAARNGAIIVAKL
ncbi:MAG: hypothetical protein ACYC4I_00695 [Minisyncoccota bacterium]